MWGAGANEQRPRGLRFLPPVRVGRDLLSATPFDSLAHGAANFRVGIALPWRLSRLGQALLTTRCLRRPGVAEKREALRHLHPARQWIEAEGLYCAGRSVPSRVRKDLA